MISVIMLTYNREKFVTRAIESILKQTYRDFEFIIVDNGSDDSSGNIADNYAVKDNRIKVIHKECGNIGSGRNAGIDVAKGDYIAFIDDDDWVEPDFLEFLYCLIKDNDADISICGTSKKNTDKIIKMSPKESLIELMRRNYYNTGFPTKMFKKSLMNNLRFSETNKFDDIEIMYKILGNSRYVIYHGLPKYVVYRHENNNSAWTTSHNLLDKNTLCEYLNSYKLRTDWMVKKFPDMELEFKYFEWSFMISMIEKINRYSLENCGELLDNMKKELYIYHKEFLKSYEIKSFEVEWMKQYVL